MFKLSLVVPCYNEENRFPKNLFGDFLSKQPTISCLFVNDGSQDATESVLKDFCKTYPNASTISLPRNLGKAEAVRFGMLKLLETDTSYLGYWDSDLATPLDEVVNFLEVFSKRPEIQLVTGARVQLLGRNIRRKKSRHYLGRVFATFASMVLNMPVYDTQCGAKIFRSNKNLIQVFSDSFLSRWIFDVEILARMGPSTDVMKQVYEYPLLSWEDVGQSKVRAFDFIKAIYELALIYRLKHSHRKHLHSDSK
jgi:glycosyltransferase involved in cell wall biosynthesis